MRWRRLQIAAACVLIGGYASLSHYCNSVGAHTVGAALSLTPVTLVSLILAWRRRPALAVLLALGIAFLLTLLWPVLQNNFSRLFLLQETGVYTLLGLSFARSLAAGNVALCTQLADALHGPLSPQEVRYTRRVTTAWSIFFFVVGTVSVILYAAAPLRVWSIYINFCVLPLIALMFIVEYLIRRRVVPQGARTGLLNSVRIYFANPHKS
jgi:uncharacterized membrane protein